MIYLIKLLDYLVFTPASSGHTDGRKDHSSCQDTFHRNLVSQFELCYPKPKCQANKNPEL